MMTIWIFCPECGRRSQRMLDEECAPRWLRCRCGARIGIAVDRQEPRSEFAAVGEDDDSWGRTGTEDEVRKSFLS